MRALITGIAGFAGSHLARYLLEEVGCEVAGIVHRQDERIADLAEQVRLYRADVRDAAAVAEIMADVRPELIFHLAAQAFVPLSWQHPWTTFEQNVQGQINVLQVLVQQHSLARTLIVSSNEVYGLITPTDLPVDEDTPFRPTSPYGVSKVAQDLLGWQYFRNYGVSVVRVRPFNHIGPGQSDRFMASSFARQLVEIEVGQREPILRVGNLTARRDFCDVRDVVRAYWLALTRGGPGEVYNIGSGRSHSVREVLDILLGLSPVDVEVVQDESRMRPSDVPDMVCDFRRLHAATGWTPTISLEQTLRDVLEDWRRRVVRANQQTSDR